MLMIVFHPLGCPSADGIIACRSGIVESSYRIGFRILTGCPGPTAAPENAHGIGQRLCCCLPWACAKLIHSMNAMNLTHMSRVFIHGFSDKHVRYSFGWWMQRICPAGWGSYTATQARVCTKL